MLPNNILPGRSDPFPDGVFLIPLCTDREAAIEMTYALDTAWKMSGKIKVIKDFLNALQHITDPSGAICLPTLPDAPEVEIEKDGDCVRVLVDGVAVTDWICPEPEEPAPEPTGRLGMTLCELEDYIMGCLDISNSIKMGSDGLIYVRSCDGWIVMQGMAAPVQTSAQQALADGLNYSQWVAAGKPPLPDLTSIPHQNTAYTTSDSVKCAKATTIVETMRHFFTEYRDMLQDIDDGMSFQAVVSAAAAGFLFGSVPGAIAVVTVAFGFKLVADNVISELNVALADVELWNDVICSTTQKMSAGTTITTGDIETVITDWQERDTVSEGKKQFIYAIPVQTWKTYGQQLVADQECGCDQYLPYQYVPPSSGSQFKIVFETFGDAVGAAPQTFPNYTVFEEPFLASHGVIQNGKYRTVYTGINNSRIHSNLGLIMKSTLAFTLQQIRVTFTAEKNFDAQEFSAQVSTGNSANWLARFSSAQVSGTAGSSYTRTLTPSSPINNANWILLMGFIQRVSTDVNTLPYMNIAPSAIEFDGTLNTGEGFVGLRLGETYQQWLARQ